MGYTQDNRMIAVETPLGKDVLLLAAFSGSESISASFSFELELYSVNPQISAADIVGRKVNLSIRLADGATRYINGLVSRFSQERGSGETAGDPFLSCYSATVVPWTWLMTQTTDSRIFQKMSTPEIVEKILNETPYADFKMLLDGNYEKRDYCVQYRETDFNFVSRLLEKDGIFYFFEHRRNQHTLVLADANSRFKECPHQATARCQLSLGGWLEEDVLTGIQWTQAITPGKTTLNDYNFEMPSTSLKVEVPSRTALGPGEREIYDYPGRYRRRAQGDQAANVRMQEEETGIMVLSGSGTCRSFSAGYRFTLKDYFRSDLNDKPYVLTSVYHHVSQGADFVSSSLPAGEFIHDNTFTCIPFDVPYRPPAMAVKPRLRGVQTAIVVGPAGEEIHTDEHGRIKVQFHWDREGSRDENSSCWMRVGQLWAGPGWGGLFIPRIGQEVIVDFLEGDPDRPIVIGCVYHGENRPPYSLPAEKTKTTIKSDSTVGGGGFNEIRFEDKKGQEQIFIHAQRNLSTVILADESRSVGGSRSTTIHKGDETLVMKEGSRDEILEMGDDSLGLLQGSRSVTIQMGDDDLHVETGNITHSAPAGTYAITADRVEILGLTAVTLQCGASLIELTPAQITIRGPMVYINT